MCFYATPCLITCYIQKFINLFCRFYTGTGTFLHNILYRYRYTVVVKGIHQLFIITFERTALGYNTGNSAMIGRQPSNILVPLVTTCIFVG